MKTYLLLPLIVSLAAASCATYQAQDDMKAMHKQCMKEAKKADMMSADEREKRMKDCDCMNKDKHGEMNMKGKSCMMDMKKDMDANSESGHSMMMK